MKEPCIEYQKKNDLIKKIKYLNKKVEKFNIKNDDIDSLLLFLEKTLKEISELSYKIEKKYFSLN